MRSPVSLWAAAWAAAFWALVSSRVPAQEHDGEAPEERDSDPGWRWNGVIGTGQSLAVGSGAGADILTTQPFHNLKLSLGASSVTVPPYDADSPALSVAALVEPIRAEVTGFPRAYPENIFGETPHTAMADQISELYAKRGDYVTVHTVVGEAGQGIDVIDKTATSTANAGHAYAATLFEVKALTRLAAREGKTYGVGAIILTHGESDAANAGYENAMLQLARDYNTDVASITGQTRRILLLTTQQGTLFGDAAILAQWRIGVDSPTEAVCVGPRYQYPYATDHLHLVARGYDQLGEKYGEVYYERIVAGCAWRPLEPISVRRVGTVITVRFHVPDPPLVWDEDLPAPHQTAHLAWSKGRGFEVSNQLGDPTIESVAIHGDAVVITLMSDPGPSDLVVRYAFTPDGAGFLGGQATGRMGQLRDSDPLVGYATKAAQYNYAVSFALRSPYVMPLAPSAADRRACRTARH
jgi:hypothetical protein